MLPSCCHGVGLKPLRGMLPLTPFIISTPEITWCLFRCERIEDTLLNSRKHFLTFTAMRSDCFAEAIANNAGLPTLQLPRKWNEWTPLTIFPYEAIARGTHWAKIHRQKSGQSYLCNLQTSGGWEVWQRESMQMFWSISGLNRFLPSINVQTKTA